MISLFQCMYRAIQKVALEGKKSYRAGISNFTIFLHTCSSYGKQFRLYKRMRNIKYLRSVYNPTCGF